MIAKTDYKQLERATIHANVFEDNQSCYYLATNQRITNRTRYYLASMHWFWSQYNEGAFTITKCPTDQMQADYLTKLPPREVFERNRKAVQGW